MSPLDGARDACRLLGGLTLDGANPALLEELAARRMARRLAGALRGDLAGHLRALGRALESEGAPAVAVEYTRLTVADGGARRPIPVPLWEDVHLGGNRRVLGERSRQVRRAYLAAGLEFDGIEAVPADHVGLELLFVAALLHEEEMGRRDAATRRDFVRAHLGPFAAALGGALERAARAPFWREVGGAVAAVPGALDGLCA